MAEMSTDNSSASAGIDLSQFYQVFFEEAGENLDNMEQLLLNVDLAAADDEELNAISAAPTPSRVGPPHLVSAMWPN
jgi:two-component system chemotaxis sensor kinase CheA